MAGLVKVALTIAMFVDSEYSPDEHANDIAASAQRFFSTSDVRVEKVEFSESEIDDRLARCKATK
jgi:hypothetical protein